MGLSKAIAMLSLDALELRKSKIVMTEELSCVTIAVFIKLKDLCFTTATYSILS